MKGKLLSEFPTLEVKYVGGADPAIQLLNNADDVKEELGIEKWDTDTIVRFLRERLL